MPTSAKRLIGAVTFVVVALAFASNIFLRGLIVDESFLHAVVTQENVSTGQANLSVERNLRLVSHNLWCSHEKPHTLWNIKERIVALAENIKDFDIALIQEAYILNSGIAVFSNCASLLVSEMTKHGFRYRTSMVDFVAPYIGKSGGIVTFSRIPLVKTSSRQFLNYSILQLMDYRGFVIAEYNVNCRRLYVVNTHLDPRRAKVRIPQSKELVTAVKQFAIPSHVIVGGDFNIDNNYPTLSNSSEEYIELQQTMNQAGLRSVFSLRMETNIDGGNYDAVFTTSNIAIVRKEIIKFATPSKKLVSDHYGLAVEIKLL